MLVLTIVTYPSKDPLSDRLQDFAPGLVRLNSFPERSRRLVDVAITVLVMGYSIANDVARQILSRSASIAL